MDCVFVAVGTEFFKFDALGGIAPIFSSSVAGHPRRSLIGVGAALGTL